MKVGDKVHYKPEYLNKPNNGIIKELHPDKSRVWVVYDCAGRWRNYQDYTAALSPVCNLFPGWK